MLNNRLTEFSLLKAKLQYFQQSLYCRYVPTPLFIQTATYKLILRSLFILFYRPTGQTYPLAFGAVRLGIAKTILHRGRIINDHLPALGESVDQVFLRRVGHFGCAQ